MKGGSHNLSGAKTMNKQRNRYTPFTGKYRMPVDEFCEKYGLSLKVVMHRMNVLYWEDFDSLVIPQELGDTSADKIRRALVLVDMDWRDDKICNRLDLTPETMLAIRNLDEYKRNMFLSMDNYFFLNPEKIDISKIFKEVEECAG